LSPACLSGVFSFLASEFAGFAGLAGGVRYKQMKFL
jgi:hypothetical protein